MAIYSKEADKTFFTFGGTDERNSTLLQSVSFFDHKTKKLARPTVVFDKHTTDAHDNAVINLDDKGYIYLFSASHGRSRPSRIARSEKPYDISSFKARQPFPADPRWPCSASGADTVPSTCPQEQASQEPRPYSSPGAGQETPVTGPLSPFPPDIRLFHIRMIQVLMIPLPTAEFQAVLGAQPEDEFLLQADRHQLLGAQSWSCLRASGKAFRM